MPRVDRAFRATAHYDDGTTASRTFLTKRARDSWAAQRLAGFPEERDVFDSTALRPALPPASHIVVADSEPLRWQPEEIRRGAP